MRARIRSIKPEAFLDEALWDLEQTTGLPIFRAFAGLWTQADREGRFEWRPRPLKASILPYWDGDFSRVLDALTTRDFVQKYAVDGREYGVVRTFKQHQVVNNKEEDSKLPTPPENLTVSNGCTRDARVTIATVTPLVLDSVEGKGKEGKGTELEGKGSESPADADDPPALDPKFVSRITEIKKVFDHWVMVMGKDKARTKLTPGRKRKTEARLRDGYTAEQLCDAVNGCKLSEFHMGGNSGGDVFDELETILKSVACVERHIARLTAPVVPKRGTAAVSSAEDFAAMEAANG